jgi:radical SAM superfamily enzyme YgiQ (UPF0313 family)
VTCGTQGEIDTTPPRELISDLDSLPFPACDLLDMKQYGRESRHHPGLVSVEHSRGCIDSCSFCILWKYMGRQPEDSAHVKPGYRTLSPQRSFDTASRLYQDFDRRTFGRVDLTLNASPRWSDEWTDLMLRSKLVGRDGRLRALHTAWMRDDCALRDEKLGVLEKLVRAGLRQVIIGVGRVDGAKGGAES